MIPRSKRQFLIGGIDVGHHTSVALLDLDGNVACLTTLVHPQNARILEYIMNFGNVMVLSTDRAKPPAQMKKIAASISAKIVLPAKNMTKKKKRLMVEDFCGKNVKMNDHEKAALASAIFAYRKFRPSFKKLEDRLGRARDAKEASRLRNKLFLRMIGDK